MKTVVFVGSHLGYPMDRTPLGGGAMVGLQLARHWAARAEFGLRLLGSGPVPPTAPREGLEYHRLAAKPEGLVLLSEFEYARFCRAFERETTDWILSRRDELHPRETCVIVNDISEGPDLEALRRAGYPLLSIWHVDVVDYFNKLYLRELVRPERLTKLYERSRKLGAAWAVPDVLKLVFEKQRQTVAQSGRMIFPSSAMAETVARCYAGLIPDRRAVRVVPWGTWTEPGDVAAAERRAAELRAHYQLGPEDKVILTLSRISPEKGLHILLEALRLLEREGKGERLCLLLCGEPAFMQGEAYMRVVRRAAQRLKRARVFFPGYLSTAQKQAYFRLADLFVSPSVHESYGLNIVEAMRAGLPVLASDHYGVRDILKPAYGRSVRYPSPAKGARPLARALEELCSDRAVLRRMGAAAEAAAKQMPFTRAADAVLEEAASLLPGAAVKA